MQNYVKPDVVKKFSGVKVQLWTWLEEEIGNQNGSFEIDQSRLAEKFEVSRTSIINALKTFVSANLLEKVSSGRGRGNHSLYRLIWTFKDKGRKNVTPYTRNNVYPQDKNITKGSKTYRYYAYKIRTAVESSSLADRSQIVTGKILKTLKKKSSELMREWFIHLKRWLEGAPKLKTLKDFFVFFHEGLMEIMRSRKKARQTRERIKQAVKKREKVKTEYQENPPPKSSDFDQFSDYLEAMEAWES